MAGLLLEAARFTTLARIADFARNWLARAEPWQADPGREMLQAADMLSMAKGLALCALSARMAADVSTAAAHPVDPSSVGTASARSRSSVQ